MGTLNFLTTNQGKLDEARNLFSPIGWNVQSFEVEGEVPDVVEPQADEIGTVALAKIAQGVEILAREGRLSESLLVEDSGLFVDALPGFPGVYSAPILKSVGLEGILKLVGEHRTANFTTVAALWTGEVVEVFVGRCEGTISEEIKGTDGFGYDPIFIPSEGDGIRTFAEMTTDEKSAISHRGRALRALAEFLSEN
ncbi:MAG: RdgB/HAM1 family non-canonical purine NTP pyrophosphatase [Candidatus Thermoplasmatota archaeon]|nr:RdgB/HAM1 family non-canonical purine NTP pyrophosphatase [Candidatus Thermoplasmatota archaeon]